VMPSGGHRSARREAAVYLEREFFVLLGGHGGNTVSRLVRRGLNRPNAPAELSLFDFRNRYAPTGNLDSVVHHSPK